MLAIAAVAYCWRLGEQGYANVYYAAAVQSAAHSWTSFFWGSVEWLNTQSMDKPPVFVWPMALSVRVFGMNPWAILLPQVLIMLAAILLLHRTVRRTHGGLAAVVAAAVMALTPIVLVMARFNDPDTALTLLAVGGAYATVRYVEAPRRRWLVLVGACVGLGFLCKWLAVFLPAVAFVAVLLADRALPLRARLRAVGVVGLSAAVFGLWWVVVYVLTPTGSRPNPDAASGGLADLLLGRNGLSRIVTHDPTTRNGMNGMPGFGRFVQWPMDGQIGWFLAPLVIALGLLAALPAARFIGPMAGRSLELRWIGKVLWVTWAVVCLGVLSFMAGSMHPYYVVIAVPAIAALIGIATDRVVAVARRDAEGARLAWILLGVVTVLTSTSGMVIMNAHADLPIGWLDVADVLVVVALAVVIGHRWWSRWPVARLLTPVGIALCALSMAWGPSPSTSSPSGTPSSAPTPSPAPRRTSTPPSSTTPWSSSCGVSMWVVVLLVLVVLGLAVVVLPAVALAAGPPLPRWPARPPSFSCSSIYRCCRSAASPVAPSHPRSPRCRPGCATVDCAIWCSPVPTARPPTRPRPTSPAARSVTWSAGPAPSAAASPSPAPR
ncbi:ArnT family glycosyltransferase [Arsenicicoccus piscis]|uniref:Glycosyltransferase RgtA/B/C/D-like domain-containing protein n=1 Tax=Arsenicicoccus piscis TaxID=673954 RepID=A0ABQ6HTL9_9MICO|nr:glycosyltransferase family 39 protein [Arsenicicoccus piscis]GMA21183.1 hypothetical protein GCM10025862_32040 [Arsenicicoccus piscis]